MLYSCPCDDRVVDIPTKLWLMISDNELDRICIEGNGCQVSNIWHGSYAETKGVMLTPEEAAAVEEDEYENEDADIPELNLDPDYYEE